MLTLDQIRTALNLRTHHGTPSYLLAEYIQCQLLDSLFKQESSAYLSFIGGTAIRLVYGGTRFSEDLDFDNFGLSFPDFQNLIASVITDMEQKGYTMEGRFVQKEAYHCYIKFPKILFDHGLSPLQDEKLIIRIDTVRKDKIFSPASYILNRFDIRRTIHVNPASIILSQKLMTIIGRKRTKGRDFFDVNFLWGQTKPDFAYIKTLTGKETNDFFRALKDRCRALDFQRLANDVERFLIYPEQKDRVTQFPQLLDQIISAYRNE